MSLANVMTGISQVEATIANVKRAYDKAPPALNEFPCFVNFPDTGDIDRTPSLRMTKHHLKLLLYVLKGAALPESEAKLRPFLDSTLNAFDSNLTLKSNCNNSRITRYSYGVLTYAGQQYLGITFDLDATEWTPYAFSA